MSKKIVRQCRFCGQDFVNAPGEHGGLCSLLCRFRSKVNENGPVPAHRPELGPCHIWTGARHPISGRGLLNAGTRGQLAHRIAWFLAHGTSPKFHICHSCDGGDIGCVRIDHLFEGTDADNSRDKIMKGRCRYPHGTAHGNAKLTDLQVVEIIAMHSMGTALPAIARRFKVATTTVHKIVKRRAWKHVRVD